MICEVVDWSGGWATPWGISVTDETLERATRVKRLIGRPQESAQLERKSTPRFDQELHFIY